MKKKELKKDNLYLQQSNDLYARCHFILRQRNELMKSVLEEIRFECRELGFITPETLKKIQAVTG